LPRVGEHADILRALGRVLDEQKARNVEIVNEETFIIVHWERAPGDAEKRVFRENDLEELREQAQAMRQGVLRGNPSSGALAELLRTLGQELDRDQIEVSSILQDGIGFTVSGMANRRYLRRTYLTSELQGLSAQRRAQRGGAPPPEESSYAARFKRLLNKEL
jgi:hypothetical protein